MKTRNGNLRHAEVPFVWTAMICKANESSMALEEVDALHSGAFLFLVHPRAAKPSITVFISSSCSVPVFAGQSVEVELSDIDAESA